MNRGAKIYYDVSTGGIIQTIPQNSGEFFIETTREQDFAIYVALAERVPDTVGMLQLEYGQYAQDFAECSGYRVDISGETPTLMFSYPDPAEPAPEPVYQKPLSVQVAEQQESMNDLTLAIADLIGTK